MKRKNENNDFLHNKKSNLLHIILTNDVYDYDIEYTDDILIINYSDNIKIEIDKSFILSTIEEEKVIEVYTDGSCSNNGNENASAGIGVWFGDDDDRNLSEKLEGEQSNNRAEIQAVIRALEIIKETEGVLCHVIVYTDSMHVLNTMTQWIDNWIENNFKKKKNVDLWKKLYSLVDEFDSIEWVHTKSHSGIYGNEKADELARKASRINK